MTLTLHRPRHWAGAALVLRLIQRVAAIWRHRKDMAELAGLDERTLADVGLTRSDVRDALSLPPWRDPTTILADRRSHRSARQYRAIFTELARERMPPPLAPGAQALNYPPTNRPARFTL